MTTRTHSPERIQGIAPAVSFSMAEEIPSNEIKKSCASCLHFDTCLIWRTVAQGNAIIKQNMGEKFAEPFDAHEIGTICKYYKSLGDSIGR